MAVDYFTLFPLFLAAGLVLLLLLAGPSPERLNQLKPLLGVAFLLAALLVPPALIGNLVAGSAGVLFLVGSNGPVVASMSAPLAPSSAQIVAVADPVRVFELKGGAGVVVFQEVDGRMVSRFYRGRANV
jgi:hypothetical protein